MKVKIASIITVMCLLFSAQVEAQEFLKQLGQLTEAIAEAVGGAVLQQAVVSSGYTQEQAQQFTRDVYSALDLNSRNAELGMSYINADNKYERQNVVAEMVFDVAGNISGQQEFVDKFRTMTDAQLSYLSENKKATSQEEKQAAFDKRTRAYADLFYDTYQEGKERQAAYLAEKMQIRNKLLQKGYSDPQFAEEVAGSIIAVQKSNLSEQEKEEILRGYGFSESPAQIQMIVNEVLADNYDAKAAANAEAEKIKAEQEAKKQAELQQRQEAERKAAEEHKNAIQKLRTTQIEFYAFDETSLTLNQKSELNAVAEILNQYSDIKVLIVGHTCNIGYKNINQRKGLNRAEASKEYLIEKGISAERISIDSKGETQPLAPNTSIENRKQNRRIEFVIE